MWLGSGQQLNHFDINNIPLLSITVQVVEISRARDLGVIARQPADTIRARRSALLGQVLVLHAQTTA